MTQTLERAGIGTAIGAIIGAIAGRGKGAAIGGIIGVARGAGSGYVQDKDHLELPRGYGTDDSGECAGSLALRRCSIAGDCDEIFALAVNQSRVGRATNPTRALLPTL